ncbi:MAG: sigma-70 family RNA polymerase sigma factor [Verrucomicrobia bacterium]|nr:sigma-70 family RNA polymerase sigma factor [Verrucomicrobiota bacterium]
MSADPAHAAFPDTRWSVVLRARSAHEPEAARALEELCRAYWYPLYAFARRCGHGAEDAEDLTQGFFARLVSRELFAKADPVKGRLRSFLLGALKHFMSEHARRERCEKRGGGQAVMSFDQALAEAWFQAEPKDEATPDLAFDRNWANAVLQQALLGLERESAQRGRAELFRRLREFLASDSEPGRLSAVAGELGMSPGAVRVAIHRLRLGFRRKLEEQIAHTVASPAELQEEMQHLRRILGA